MRDVTWKVRIHECTEVLHLCVVRHDSWTRDPKTSSRKERWKVERSEERQEAERQSKFGRNNKRNFCKDFAVDVE